MHDREHDVDEHSADEHGMPQAEEQTETPARVPDGDEEGVVQEREQKAGGELQHIADELGAHAIGGERRAEQERHVHAGPSELGGARERGRQHEGAGEASRECGPDAHESFPWMAAAALMSARWTSPWGKLPRNSWLSGAISSE